MAIIPISLVRIKEQKSMKLKLSISLLLGCVLTAISTISIVSQAKASDEVRFICASGFDQGANKRLPTTYAWTPRGKIAVVRWKYSWFNNQNFTPQQRCQDVSSRLQNAYDKQSLGYITNGIVNGQSVICTANQKDGACDITLLTLRPQDDPLEILSDLKDILRGRGTGPIQHSSGKHQVYYQIDIQKFLQTAPVEKE